MDDSRLVYSTEPGRVAKQQSRSNRNRGTKSGNTSDRTTQAGDGKVRIRREVKGRKGKQVTVVLGLPADDEGLKQTAARLKRLCGSGGSIKDGSIIIQGDHRKTVHTELTKQGYKVSIAGG